MLLSTALAEKSVLAIIIAEKNWHLKATQSSGSSIFSSVFSDVSLRWSVPDPFSL